MAVIGSVGVRVAPSFTGVGSSVARVFSQAGRDAASAVSRPVKTSLREALRTSFTSASSSALASMESATVGVTRAEEGLQKAKRDSEAASASAMRAEERLEAKRNSGKASAGDLAAAEADLNAKKASAEAASAGLSAAEDRVADAKRQAATASKEYEAALSREDSVLYKMETALPIIGDRVKGVGESFKTLGGNMSAVGGDLTRKITVPVVGATAAVGGLVAGLGFQRLVGLDSAQAKLRGLGYEASEVEDISGQVTTAIEGTMVTMAEGVDIAAGALAAGIDEGEELESYIRLVGDAAIASGRSTSEMAQIFNRVEGSGKLMTQELNMLEQSVPGVTAALADSYGVAQDEFREMVTNGEVDAEHFRGVMDEFMGGMGEAYSDSFAGMAKNITAYLGIVGEEMLSGAFPKIKESMAEFIEYLQSDAVMDFAAKVGEFIGDAFERILGIIQSVIEWWTNLSGTVQKFILIALGVLVALGPILLIVGKIITFIGGVVTAIGSIISIAGPVIGVLGKIGGAFAFLANPITWIIAGIAALTAGLVWFFTQTEMGQNIVSTAWAWIQGAIGAVVDWAVGTAWPMLQSAWAGIVSGAEWLWGIIKSVWGGVKAAISAVVDWAVGTAWPMIQSVWDGIVSGAQWLWGILEPIFIMIVAIFLYVGQTLWNIYSTLIKAMWDAFVAIVQWVWNSILQPIFNFILDLFRSVGVGMMAVWTGVLKPVFNFLADIVRWVWDNVIRPYFNAISRAWSTMSELMRGIYANYIQPMFARFRDFVASVADRLRYWFHWIRLKWAELRYNLYRIYATRIRPIFEALRDFVARVAGRLRDFFDRIRNSWSVMRDRLNSIWVNRLRPVFRAVGNFVKNDLVGAIEDGIDFIKKVWGTVANIFRKPINWVINTVWNNGLRKAYNTVAGMINADKLGRVSGISKAPAFAKGGYHKGGWATVGEEGPELAYFGRDARILTNEQTMEIAKSGIQPTEAETDLLRGNTAPSDAPIGGLWDTVRRGAKWVGDKTGISTAVDWARGKLAEGIRLAMKPILGLVDGITSDFGTMGSLAGDFLKWGVDGVADWVDSKDQEGFQEGVYNGKFVANPGGFNRPSGGVITSPFGRRWGRLHAGIDIAGPHRSPVRAAWDGVVSFAGWGPGRLGNLVRINHGSYETAYGHLDSIMVGAGQNVSGGQQIGRQGASGGNFGSHLHFERHVPGWYNPVSVNSLFRDKGGLIYPGLNMVRNETGAAEYTFERKQFQNVVAATEEIANGGGRRPGDINQYNYRHTTDYEAGQDLKQVFRGSKFKRG